MARIHLFAADTVASLDAAASSGGLRAAQLVQALQSGGHDVGVSIPAQAVVADPLGPQPLLHSRRTYLNLLNRLRPEVVVWMEPRLRNTPFGAGMVHVCDLQALGAPDPGPRDDAARHVAGADLVLAASAGQDGFWAAALGQRGATSAIVPYATPASLRLPPQPGASALRRLHVPDGMHLRPGGMAWLVRAAAWCGPRGVSLHVAAPTAGTADVAAMQALHALEGTPGVHLSGAASLRAALDGYGPGSVLLDLADGSPERRLTLPVAVVDALAHGVPPVMNCGGDPALRLLRSNAAALVPPGASPDDGVLEQVLDALAALSPEALGAMSAAAHGCAARWFDPADAQAALLEALDRAAQTRTPRRTVQPASPPQVLVMTEQGSNMRGVRVDLPLGALHREGRVGGYAIWSRGRLGFSTRAGEADPSFDAIWVQRDLPADAALALGALDRPYLLDIDDNLLVSPAYRPPFSAAQLQASRSLVRGCAAVTTSSDRLAGLLQDYAHTTLLDRAVTCPNLVTEGPPWVVPGPPSCVVWASSDAPALTAGYVGIVRAVRDFCLAHALRLVCIGAPPPGLAVEAGVTTEHVGMMTHPAYLQHLRALAPAILMAPLDTGADPVTQDFIDGKSDVKVLEALMTGLVGVFSDAPAYRDTNLPAPILCRNDYAGWLAGLERARQLCVHGTPRHELPPGRMASGPGLDGWAEALRRVRLRHPVRLSELEQALALARATLVRRLLTPGEFDATWYVSVNHDVEQAVAAGQITAYGHYSAHGFFEGRPGHPGDLAHADADGFWSGVLNTLSDVRASLEGRAAALDAVRARRQRRLKPGSFKA